MILAPRTMIELAAPWLEASPLVASPAWAGVERLADDLPPLFQHAYFEMRLAPGDDRTDFMVAASELHEGRARVKGMIGDGLDLGAAEPSRPVLEAWCEPASPLGWCPLLWLEYDLPDGPGSRPGTPGLGLCLDPHHYASSRNGVRSVEERVASSAHGIGLVDGVPARVEQLEALGRIARALPVGGLFEYAASLAPRGRDRLRVVCYLPGHGLDAWLRSIDWCGAAEHLDLIRTAASSKWGLVGIQIEIEGGRVTPYLACELSVGEGRHRLAAATDLLAAWIDQGWCDPGKSAGITRWHGWSRMHDSPTGWPLSGERSLILKLTGHEDGRVETKAYLGLHYQHAPW